MLPTSSPSRALPRAAPSLRNLRQRERRTKGRARDADDGHGYLLRFRSYWRFEEADGGVYVQLESIELSRFVPAIFVWLVNPLLRSTRAQLWRTY